MIGNTKKDEDAMSELEDAVEKELDGLLEDCEHRIVIVDKDGDVYGFGRWISGALAIVVGYSDPGDEIQTEDIVLLPEMLTKLQQWLKDPTSIISTDKKKHSRGCQFNDECELLQERYGWSCRDAQRRWREYSDKTARAVWLPVREDFSAFDKFIAERVAFWTPPNRKDIDHE